MDDTYEVHTKKMCTSNSMWWLNLDVIKQSNSEKRFELKASDKVVLHGPMKDLDEIIKFLQKGRQIGEEF